MANPWDDWTPGKPPPNVPPPTVREDPAGYANYQQYLAESQDTNKPSSGGGGTSGGGTSSSPQRGSDTPIQAPPQARAAYGPYLAGDLANRTVGIDEKTRVDPYSGQRYRMGSDGTWDTAGFLSRQDQADLRATGALPPVGQDVRNQNLGTPAMGSNAIARGGAGRAGMVGGVGPLDTPQLAAFQGMTVPGLGFNAADYRPGNANINLDSIRLPTPVATRPYGFDFGPGAAAGGGLRTTGPAAVDVQMPNYQVPNTYMGGPSGFSATGPNGPYFQPMAIPFNVSNPTFGPLAQSAPATISPTLVNQQLAPGTYTQAGGGNQYQGAVQSVNDLINRFVPGAAPAGGGAAEPQSYTPGDKASFYAAMAPLAQAWSQQTGIPPEVYMAINGSESNFGNAGSLFGMKGTGDAGSRNYATQEVQNGQRVNVNDQFANYSSPNAAYQAFNDLVSGGRYAPAWQQFQQDKDAGAFLQNINKAGYATDPNWANMIQGMAGEARQYLPGINATGGVGSQPYGPNALPWYQQLVQNTNALTGFKPPAAGASQFSTGGGSYEFQPVGPGALQPANMQSPGGAGVLQISGPQTAEIRNGGVGMGWNPDIILRDSGRGANVPNDPVAKAVASMALMNAQQSMMNNPAAPMNALDAYLAMKEPAMSNYGAQPDKAPGQAAAAQAATSQAQADDRRREDEAMWAGDGRTFAEGGTVEMVPPPRMERRYARGGSVVAPVRTTDEGGLQMGTPTQNINVQQPQANQQKVPGLAKGGTVATTPGVSAPVAPIRTTEEQGGIVPGAAQQTAQQMQQPLAQPSAETASASNTEANLSPIQSGATSSVETPNYQLGTVNQQAGYGTNAVNPTASPTGIAPVAQADTGQTSTGANPDLYKPFNDALAYLQGVNRIRQNQSVWRLGQLGTPTAVGALMPGQTPQNLPPGVYYDPTPVINQRVSDIKNLQDQLAAYGNPGTEQQIIAQQNPLQQQENTFGTINQLQRDIAGYGQVGTPAEINARLAAIGQDITKYGNAKDYLASIAALGPAGNSDQLNAQISQIKSDMQPYQAVQDLIMQKKALGDTSGDVASLLWNADYLEKPPMVNGVYVQNPDPIQAAALRAQANNIAKAQQLDQQIHNLDPQGTAVATLGQYQTKLDAAQQALADVNKSSAQRTYYQNLLDSLNIPQGADVNVLLGQRQAEQQAAQTELGNAGKVGQLQTELANQQAQVAGTTQAQVEAQLQLLADQLTRSRKVSDTTTQLGNLLAQGVPGAGQLPGFSTGGSITSGIRGDLSGIRGQASGIRGSESGIRGEESGIRGYAKGGNWIAGATSNSHGQFKAKAQAAGMSTRAYANKMADAPGRTGKQARLAKTLMSFAGGGTMVTPEPIMGVGMVTGKPRFMVGEPQRPGGPPMQEKLTITPLNRPNQNLPMGVMQRAA